MNNAHQRRPGTLGASPRRPLTPPKAKNWSHQDDLLAMRGKMVRLQFRDGATSDLVLLDADQFALKVCKPHEQSSLIVWKHDLASVGLLAGAN